MFEDIAVAARMLVAARLPAAECKSAAAVHTSAAAANLAAAEYKSAAAAHTSAAAASTHAVAELSSEALSGSVAMMTHLADLKYRRYSDSYLCLTCMWGSNARLVGGITRSRGMIGVRCKG